MSCCVCLCLSIPKQCAGLNLTGDPVVKVSSHVAPLVSEIQTITTSAILRHEEQAITIRALASPSRGSHVPEVQQVTVTNATGGSFTLTILNATARIPYSATGDMLRQALLDSIPSLSTTAVSRTDVSAVERQWLVTFIAYEGDLPSLVSNVSGLTSVSATEVADVVVTEVVKGAVQEVQLMTFAKAPIGGHFTLTYMGSSTASLLHNASASDVRAALESLPSLGEVEVEKSYNGTIPVWRITFIDVVGNLPLLSSVSNLWAGDTVREPSS